MRDVEYVHSIKMNTPVFTRLLYRRNQCAFPLLVVKFRVSDLEASGSKHLDLLSAGFHYTHLSIGVHHNIKLTVGISRPWSAFNFFKAFSPRATCQIGSDWSAPL